jgi:hypothetical protein
VEHVKPAPSTWVQTATVSWLNRNETVDQPNPQTISLFEAEDSKAQVLTKQKAREFEQLRNEHTKVHMEDQRLLSVLSMMEQSKMTEYMQCEAQERSIQPSPSKQ